MVRAVAIASALGLLAVGAVGAGPAFAAAPPVAGGVGWAASSVAGCPNIQWRVARHADGSITGIVFYSDMSGMSTVTGTEDSSGHFTATMTKGMGDGPVGTVTGTRSADGTLTAVMKGEGCANATIDIKPTKDLNALVNATGR